MRLDLLDNFFDEKNAPGPLRGHLLLWYGAELRRAWRRIGDGSCYAIAATASSVEITALAMNLKFVMADS